MKPKVYVTRLIPEKGLEMVLAFCEVEVWEGELPEPREVLLDKVQDVEGLLSLLTDRIDGQLMDAAPRGGHKKRDHRGQHPRHPDRHHR